MAILSKTFNIMIKIGYVLLLIILAVMILKKIIYGGSDALIVGLILANLAYSWHINNQLQRHIGQHEGYRKRAKDEFL